MASVFPLGGPADGGTDVAVYLADRRLLVDLGGGNLGGGLGGGGVPRADSSGGLTGAGEPTGPVRGGSSSSGTCSSTSSSTSTSTTSTTTMQSSFLVRQVSGVFCRFSHDESSGELGHRVTSTVHQVVPSTA